MNKYTFPDFIWGERYFVGFMSYEEFVDFIIKFVHETGNNFNDNKEYWESYFIEDSLYKHYDKNIYPTKHGRMCVLDILPQGLFYGYEKNYSNKDIVVYEQGVELL